jgi:hypothetical protein
MSDLQAIADRVEIEAWRRSSSGQAATAIRSSSEFSGRHGLRQDIAALPLARDPRPADRTALRRTQSATTWSSG